MERRKYLHGVDLARFLAACLVVAHHLYELVAKKPDSLPAMIVGPVDFKPVSWFDFGAVGVQIFFVISGLVIAESCLGKTGWGFIRGRAERLFPMVWAIIPVALAIVLVTGAMPLRPALMATINCLILSPTGQMIEPVMWTLRVEVAFYAVVACWILIGRPFKIEALAILIGILSGGYNLGVALHGLGLGGMPPLSSAIERITLLSHGCFFAAGILIWSSLRRRLSLGMGLMLATIAAGCALQIGVGEFADGEFRSRAVLVWAIVCGLMWASAAWSKPWSPARARIARTVGLMTYPLYLLHQTVGSYVMRLLVHSGTGGIVAAVAGGIVAVAASFVLAVWVEPRLRRHLRAAIDGLETAVRGRRQLLRSETETD